MKQRLKFFATVLLLLGSSQARADTNSHIELFRSACLEPLYQIEAARPVLLARGWYEVPRGQWGEHPMLSALNLGLVPERTLGFSAPDNDATVVIGQQDNDLYPNMQCFYSSQDLNVDVDQVDDLFTQMLPEAKRKRLEGKRYDNITTYRQMPDWERNHSPEAPYHTLQISYFPKPTPFRGPGFGMVVVGLLPR